MPFPRSPLDFPIALGEGASYQRESVGGNEIVLRRTGKLRLSEPLKLIERGPRHREGLRDARVVRIQRMARDLIEPVGVISTELQPLRHLLEVSD